MWADLHYVLIDHIWIKKKTIKRAKIPNPNPNPKHASFFFFGRKDSNIKNKKEKKRLQGSAYLSTCQIYQKLRDHSNPQVGFQISKSLHSDGYLSLP